MTYALNTAELVARVGERLHDQDQRLFTATQILAAADDVLRTMWSDIRTAGEFYGGDYQDIAFSTAVTVSTRIFELTLPSYIGDIQKVEMIQGEAQIPLVEAGLEDLDGASARGQQLLPTWIFVRGMSLPVLQIRGRIEGLGTVRVWYIRNWGPLHTATIGSGPTTTSISFGALTAGVYKNRTDIYKGMELEITTDPAPANVGQIARCSAFSNGVFTITPALPNTPTNASTTYALLIPIPTDGIAYFTEKVCSDMLRRSGNMEEWQMLQPELARLEENFTDHLTRRASGEPKRLFSSRLKRF